jgi:tetratricopeptide (TPR) repeat protein
MQRQYEPEHFAQVKNDSRQLAPPSRRLVALVTGGIALYILTIVVGLVLFREVLRPGQQQRVITMLPFMQSFLPPRPGPDAILPTALFESSDLTVDALLQKTESIQPTPVAALAAASTLSPTPLASFTPTPVLTVTAPPTVPATSTPVATATRQEVALALPAVAGRPAAARLDGIRYVLQGWNNCGPATITMGLSYFGWEGSQEFAASLLKPDDEDKNVTPREMVGFVNEQSNVRAVTRVGGNLELLKALLAEGFPVLISIGFMPEGYDWLGHYRLLVAYDDNQGAFFAYDSYLGTGETQEGIVVPYTEAETIWRQFNRTFIVLYSPDEEARVAALLGDLAVPSAAAEIALETARTEARMNPVDGYAWFNMGTALVALERYEEAAVAYDQALQAGLPWRMLWYQFGPYEAYLQVGRLDDVLALGQANLTNGGGYVEETFYWMGRAYAALGRFEEAAEAFQNALKLNPRYTEAQTALAALDLP